MTGRPATERPSDGWVFLGDRSDAAGRPSRCGPCSADPLALCSASSPASGSLAEVRCPGWRGRSSARVTGERRREETTWIPRNRRPRTRSGSRSTRRHPASIRSARYSGRVDRMTAPRPSPPRTLRRRRSLPIPSSGTPSTRVRERKQLFADRLDERRRPAALEH